MECPKCHALAFLGEWQTPKEMQSSKSRKCDNCSSDVSTVYLIQPKEKRRGMEISIIDLLENNISSTIDFKNMLSFMEIIRFPWHELHRYI